MNIKIIIVYGTKRGVTSSMADEIVSSLEKAGFGYELRNVYEVRPKMLENYDLIILGSSTWSDGDLQSDFIEFERDMDHIDLSGKYAAVFGPGNSRYRFFAEAVEILESRLRSVGAKIICPSLKSDELAGKMNEEASSWAEVMIEKIKKTFV